jgi:hypothetical protein
LFLASHSIKKEKDVSLLMAYHMNGKNKKGNFKTEWELIDKEKKKPRKEVERVVEKIKSCF